jgi:hypothetical protein
MAVIVLDRAWLSSSLQPLAQHQRGAFAASCVQRLAPGFLDSPAVGAVGVLGRLPDRRAGGDAVRGAQLGAVAHQLRPAVRPARLLRGGVLGPAWHSSSRPTKRPVQPRELQRQQEDLAAISAARPEAWETVLDQMRQASEAYSTDFLAAIESTT